MLKIPLFVLIVLVISACQTTTAPAIPLPTLVPLPEEVPVLPAWETRSGTLTEANAVQRWQFSGTAGEAIRIRTVDQGAAATLRLLLGDSLLAEGESVELTLPQNAIYWVDVIRASGSGQYDIGLSYTDRPNPASAAALPQVVGVPTPTPAYADVGVFIREIDGSEAIGGLLNAQGARHIYTLRGTAGDVVNAALYRIAGTLDPVLRLYDPQGDLVAMDDNSLGAPNARLLNLVLPADGLYTVQVDGKGLFGDYTLEVTRREQSIDADPVPTSVPTAVAVYTPPQIVRADPDARLEPHVPVLSAIEREGGFQRFSFFAFAGQRISVRVLALDGSAIQPQFEIFDPEGIQIAAAQPDYALGGGIAYTLNLTIAQEGAHIIIVTAADNTVGTFTVAYGEGTSVADRFRGDAPSGVQVGGALEAPASRDVWLLPLNPGDVISVAVSAENAGFDPVVEIVTADERVIYRDDDSGANNAALIQLAEIREPASYLVRVTDASGQGSGAYTLLWRYVNIAPTPTPPPAKALLLASSDQVAQSEYQFYAFQGRAGQRIQIDVVSAPSSGLDPVLALLSPDGEIIAEADDSNGTLNPSLQTTLPVDGTYSVRVNGYLSGGAFDLEVALLIDD